MPTSIRVTKQCLALDCPDAVALAQFYASLLGWDIARIAHEEQWVEVHPPGADRPTFYLAFQRIDNYRVPDWPVGPVPQQGHLDLYVTDLAEATETAIATGAELHEHQPSEDGSFLVFTDPVGHPFCLCVDLT